MTRIANHTASVSLTYLPERIRLALLFFLIVLLPYAGKTQHAVVDSLTQLLATATSDSVKSRLLTELNYQLFNQDLAKAIYYGRENLRLIKTSTTLHPTTLPKGYLMAARTYVLLNKYDSAELLINAAIEHCQQKKIPKYESAGYTDLGVLAYFKGDNPKAIGYYIRAKQLAEQNNLSTARINGSMAATYRHLKQYDQSLRYFNVAVRQAEKEKMVALKYSIMGEMALICIHLNKYDSAKLLLSQCKVFQVSKNNSLALCKIYANLANLAKIEQNYKDQFEFALQVKSHAIKANSREDMGVAYIHMSLSKFGLRQFNEARLFGEKALEDGKDGGSIEQQRIATRILARIAMYDHDVQKAEHYFVMNDSLEMVYATEKQKEATAEIMTRYETEKKEQENQALRDAQTQQENLTIVIASFAAVLLLMLVLLFRSFRNQRNVNNILKEKNNEIENHREEILVQNVAIEKNNGELTTTLKNLHDTQAQLLHAEKMASLGLLTAGIAHEINNPINFISAGVESLAENIILLQESVIALPASTGSKNEINTIQSIFHEVLEFGKVIRIGCDRTEKIVAGLQKFAHKGSSDFKEAHPITLVNDTLMLMHGTILDRIKVTTNFAADIPAIHCKPQEISQALLNVFINAAQSIQGKGTIHITMKCDEESVTLTISDNGMGIEAEHLNKIFDPFFTTKDVGKGTGLGLSITHGIIKSHGGEISFQSIVGEGTTCTIQLPLTENKKQTNAISSLSKV